MLGLCTFSPYYLYSPITSIFSLLTKQFQKMYGFYYIRFLFFLITQYVVLRRSINRKYLIYWVKFIERDKIAREGSKSSF